ncbi:MAG: CAAX prenyl protease-related protein [Kiritimatiellaeota bacterium]|nr:CAAX prenyl protease-related protein [Kiritimatiellota bacterium]
MQTDRRIFAGHVVPFVVWVGVIFLLQGLASVYPCPRVLYPWGYAVKSVVCAGLFLWLKPWRVYPVLKLSNVPLALLVGVIVAVVWIVPETPWLGRTAPNVQAFYHRWCIMMPGTFPNYYNPDFFPALPYGHLSLAFSPSEAGWGLTIMKLVGSAGVIAVIEEFFFRGFFYRWLRNAKFWRISLTSFDMHAFWVVVAVFGLEHDRWLAGMFAGVAYGWLTIRTGDVWAAALSHALTNLLLAVYVIGSGQYGFW